jgi:hypothetical protein
MNAFRSPLFILLIVFSLFSLSSCTKEESYTPNPSFANPNYTPNSSSNLVGAWKLVSLDYAGTSTNGGASSQFSAVGKSYTYVITFSENPNNYVTTGGYTVALTTELGGISFTQDITLTDYASSGTWQLKGDTLTTVDGTTGDTGSTEILSMSKNEFSMDFAGFFGKSVMGADVVFSSGQVTYKRK